MKRNTLYILASAAVLLPVLTGCSSETGEPDTPVTPGTTSGIEIMGGVPGGLPMETRATNPPSQFGLCNADSIRIWMYRGVKITTIVPQAGDMTYNNETFSVESAIYNTDYCNKLAYFQYPLATMDGSRNTGYAMPAIAYSHGDYKAFKVDPATYSTMSLSLSDVSYTPELYFGRLRFHVEDNKGTDLISDASDGVFYRHNTGIAATYTNAATRGKLYRLVSQMNINVSDVNDRMVDKMELYFSNVPKEMVLFGNHGVYYPVAAAAGAAQHTPEAKGAEGWVKVATLNKFHKGNGTLSAFLLPSMQGRRMMVRIYYAEGMGPYDTAGNQLSQKDFEIQAPQNAYIPESEREVYSASTPDSLKNGADLCVYNTLNQRFYSYSNIRININGKYENLFPEKTPAKVEIEVCPAYENQHEFDF